jgi:hypothetical protein
MPMGSNDEVAEERSAPENRTGPSDEVEAKRLAIRTFRAATTLLELLPASWSRQATRSDMPAPKRLLDKLRKDLDALAFLFVREHEVVACVPLGTKTAAGEFFELAALQQPEHGRAEPSVSNQATADADELPPKEFEEDSLDSDRGNATTNVPNCRNRERAYTVSDHAPEGEDVAQVCSQSASALPDEVTPIIECDSKPSDFVVNDGSDLPESMPPYASFALFRKANPVQYR